MTTQIIEDEDLKKISPNKEEKKEVVEKKEENKFQCSKCNRKYKSEQTLYRHKCKNEINYEEKYNKLEKRFNELEKKFNEKNNNDLEKKFNELEIKYNKIENCIEMLLKFNR